MTKKDVMLRCEGTAEGYLYVDINGDGNRMTLTQSGLDKQVVKALGLHSKYLIATATPIKCTALPHNSSDKPTNGTFNYAAVVGILLYLT